jgi:Leucine Rich repeat
MRKIGTFYSKLPNIGDWMKPPPDVQTVAAITAWVESGGLGPTGLLDLSWRDLNDSEFHALCLAPWFSRLTGLDLKCNEISDTGIQSLVSSPHLGKLVWLSLEVTQVGDIGAAALSACPSFAELAVLNLNTTRS